jgi:hypothetical protein
MKVIGKSQQEVLGASAADATDRVGGLRPEPTASSQPSGRSPTGAGPERIDVPEFHRRLKAQGVSANRHMALVCPMCGTVQSMASLVAAGAAPEKAERLIGFSCEGRLTGAGPWANKPSAKRRAMRGCDWSLGGLFRIHKLEVIDGTDVCPRFEVASAEQAQALEALIGKAA